MMCSFIQAKPIGLTNDHFYSNKLSVSPAVTQKDLPQGRHRVKRNIFGSPKAGETERLLREETQRISADFFNRFELIAPETIDTLVKAATGVSSSISGESLIEKERQQYEEKRARCYNECTYPAAIASIKRLKSSRHVCPPLHLDSESRSCILQKSNTTQEVDITDSQDKTVEGKGNATTDTSEVIEHFLTPVNGEPESHILSTISFCKISTDGSSNTTPNQECEKELSQQLILHATTTDHGTKFA